MELKLTFLGRVANRWRVHVELPPGARPRGLTVGLWGEDDKPLGPAVVAPPDIDGAWEAELAGPVPLPPGTLVRCVADLEDGAPAVYWHSVDRRKGLHAFLHADGRLPLESDCAGAALTEKEIARLARAFPWVRPEAPPSRAPPPPVSEEDDGIPPELRDMLKDDFGIDIDAMDDDLDFVKG